MESKISSFHPNHKALRVDSAGNPAPPPPPPFTGNFLFIPPLTTPKSPTPPIIYNILYIQFKPIKISKKKKKIAKDMKLITLKHLQGVESGFKLPSRAVFVLPWLDGCCAVYGRVRLFYATASYCLQVW